LLALESITNVCTTPCGTPSRSVISGAAGWVGPRMKLPVASTGGTAPSGSSMALVAVT
jgi:hypothetical protein